MYDHIFLDVAQTLLHKKDLLPTIVRTLDRHGVTADESLVGERHQRVSEMTPFPDKTSKDHYLEFNQQLLVSLGVNPSETIARAIYCACRALTWVAYSDVANLARLNGTVGIISNWDGTLREKLRSLIPLDFEPIIVSSEVGSRKPDPEIFRFACSRLQCEPSRIVHVGDSLRLDIEPALTVGMQAVLLDRDNRYPNYTGIRIRSLNELTAAVEQA